MRRGTTRTQIKTEGEERQGIRYRVGVRPCGRPRMRDRERRDSECRSAGVRGAEPTATTDTDITHEHDWAIQYDTVVHDEVSHEEVVQPVYERIVTHHSVCNDCNEIVDGHAQEHIDATGHSGYSTNVPVTESRLVSEGRIDVIVDEPAYEELVATGRTCTICGENS